MQPQPQPNYLKAPFCCFSCLRPPPAPRLLRSHVLFKPCCCCCYLLFFLAGSLHICSQGDTHNNNKTYEEALTVTFLILFNWRFIVLKTFSQGDEIHTTSPHRLLKAETSCDRIVFINSAYFEALETFQGFWRQGSVLCEAKESSPVSWVDLKITTAMGEVQSCARFVVEGRLTGDDSAI